MNIILRGNIEIEFLSLRIIMIVKIFICLRRLRVLNIRNIINYQNLNSQLSRSGILGLSLGGKIRIQIFLLFDYLYNIVYLLLFFNMHTQNQQKSLIDPYRTMGIFVSGPLTLSKSHPHALTTATGSSFRVYSQTLGMKVVSPPLGSEVTFACSYNQYTYVRVKDSILKLKYHHIVKRWSIAGSG